MDNLPFCYVPEQRLVGLGILLARARSSAPFRVCPIPPERTTKFVPRFREFRDLDLPGEAAFANKRTSYIENKKFAGRRIAPYRDPPNVML